jgi:hypothetical protein
LFRIIFQLFNMILKDKQDDCSAYFLKIAFFN